MKATLVPLNVLKCVTTDLRTPVTAFFFNVKQHYVSTKSEFIFLFNGDITEPLALGMRNYGQRQKIRILTNSDQTVFRMLTV